MEAKDVWTLSISLLALLVALYGIFERRSAARHATRLRLSEVIDELNELGVEEAKPLENEEEHIRRGWTAQLNGRREVLCAMADSLVDKLPEGVTEREFSSVAVALRRLGDWAGASRYWQRAMDTVRKGTAYEVFVLRGYASHQLLCSELEAGRAFFRRALDVPISPQDNQLTLKAETYMTWAAAEAEAGGSPETIDSLVDAGREALTAVRHDATRRRYEHIYELRADDVLGRTRRASAGGDTSR